MSMLNKEIGDFSVQAYRNNAFATVTKEDVLGKWSVFFFYPADFSFVCTTEMEDLAGKYDEFRKAGCEIYAVSCDSHYVHKAWHDSEETIGRIRYPMLADPAHVLARDFEILTESAGMTARGSFIINPEGRIAACSPKCGRTAAQSQSLPVCL